MKEICPRNILDLQITTGEFLRHVDGVVYCTERNDAASTDDKATRQANAAHTAVVTITMELKQLEMLAAEIEESANRLSTLADDAATDADDVQTSLHAAQQNDQVIIRYLVRFNLLFMV